LGVVESKLLTQTPLGSWLEENVSLGSERLPFIESLVAGQNEEVEG
jgi:hypothetical protein